MNDIPYILTVEHPEAFAPSPEPQSRKERNTERCGRPRRDYVSAPIKMFRCRYCGQWIGHSRSHECLIDKTTRRRIK